MLDQDTISLTFFDFISNILLIEVKKVIIYFSK